MILYQYSSKVFKVRKLGFVSKKIEKNVGTFVYFVLIFKSLKKCH